MPNGSPTFRIQHAILSVLQPLTGDRSAGSVTARATGADVVVEKNTYLVAAPAAPSGGKGQLDYTLLFKTTAETTVTSSGTPVPVVSVLGGARQNLPAGTPLAWYPPVDGLNLLATVTNAGITGARAPDGLEAVQQIVCFESVVSGQDFFRAGAGKLPALVVCWEGANDGEKAGIAHTIRDYRFRIFVGVDRLDSQNPRRNAGLAILDALAELLLDRSSVDGEVFSAPPCAGGAAGRLRWDPANLMYYFDLKTSWSTRRRDAREKVPWTMTRIESVTVPDDVHPDPGDELLIVDTTVSMT